ncbi:MAG: rod shape-determining protein MreC [Candidatus Rokubacteria bacterium]|nr:rod shape-determining protein MreC [Candidatus Rokubacteria bacterium]
MKHRKYALLVSLLLVSLLLLSVRTPGGGGAWPGDLVGALLTPLQVTLAKIQRSALGVWSAYLDWKHVRSENQSLRAEVERLRIQALRVEDAHKENLRLRRLLALRDRLPLSTLAGEVIAKEWGGWVRSLTVNRGRGDRVARLSPVIVPEGLVGRVVEVRAQAAVVQLINDPSSAVAVMVQRTRTAGVAEGEPGGTVRLKFMARAGGGVQVGDLIVTSGLGGLFPKGLPVGRVTAVEDKGSALFHFALLAPVADFARVEEVLLLTGPTGADLFPHFSPGPET